MLSYASSIEHLTVCAQVRFTFNSTLAFTALPGYMHGNFNEAMVEGVEQVKRAKAALRRAPKCAERCVGKHGRSRCAEKSRLRAPSDCG